MRSDWIKRENMDIVLACLMPSNALAFEVALQTGLRIGDVLAIRSDRLKKRMYVREAKTNKARQVYLPNDLLARMQDHAGEHYVFPGRNDPTKHRTRQAVWYDLHRAATLLRASGVVQRGQTVSPHTARKMYAVEKMEQTGDLAAVGKLLNHEENRPEVTMLYALADSITEKKLRARRRR